MKESKLRKIIREELLKESSEYIGHHHLGADDQWYVDSNFINYCKNVLPGSELKHAGFGEFYLKTRDGDVQFDRSAGKKFSGQVGRSHKIYDDRGDSLVDNLIDKMVKLGKTEEV